MRVFSYNTRVKLLLRYFKRKAKRKIKPDLIGNHHFRIIHKIGYNRCEYFDGGGFTDNIFGASEFCDIESLKADLIVARKIYACTKVHQLNTLIKETLQFIKEYKQIRKL